MKTVITDLDGTLLNNAHLSNYSIDVLKEFQKENRLVLATGRNLNSVKHIYEQLDMDKYKTGALILINGLSFYDFKNNEYICLDSLSTKEAKHIIHIAYLLLFRITVVTSDKRIKIYSLYDKIYSLLRYIIKQKPMTKYDKRELPNQIEKIELGGTVFFVFFFFIDHLTHLKKILF